MTLPKIKYITNPQKSDSENKRSELTFRKSTKFIFAQCIIAPILGLLLSQFSIVYFISGAILFSIVYLISKNIKNKTIKTSVEFTLYFLSGTSFALIISSIFAILIQAITFIL